MSIEEDGGSVEVQGSGKKPYILKNSGGVFSCSCPAWRNQSLAIEKRTCKHLRKVRGDEVEATRTGGALPAKKAEKKAGPPLLLAHKWDNDQDLTGWWLSEKLDGVRAYWDGTQFLSRQGNKFFAPEWRTAAMPTTPLDGELWIARGEFQRTVSIVRRQDHSVLWKEVKYRVFDMPELKLPFEERMDRMQSLLGDGRYYAEILEQKKCLGIDHVLDELIRVEDLGGEGLMLREPGSLYEAGRSTSLLKVKTFHDDEATVVGYVAGKGRHKGRTGSLEVELADGTAFCVGTGLSDAEREAPPKVGTVITFRYQELTKDGVPRFPSYLRVRQ